MELELGIPNLKQFAATLQELAEKDPDLIAVTGDSRGSGKLNKYAEDLPDQIVEVGIAEQNAVGVSAGLSSAGKKVYTVIAACFLTARSFEQIKNDVCYSDHPVKLIGISAGVSYGALGSTHHSTHDIAAFRALNNLDIVIPADNFETREAITAALHHDRPIYIRMGKRPMYHLHSENEQFEIGKAMTIREGDDVAFIATGETVYPAWEAAERLQEAGISAQVISMHTIRPLDTDVIRQAAEECSAIVTVEEHSVHGGLGEACASLLMQAGIYAPLKIVGIPDEYTVTGSQLDIFRHYGITGDGLANTARELLEQEIQYAK